MSTDIFHRVLPLAIGMTLRLSENGRIKSPGHRSRSRDRLGADVGPGGALDRLTTSQASRFFYYEYKGVPRIPREEIVSHATNLQLIPSDKAIATQCRSLQSGDLIHLAGLLVEASVLEIGTWRSSLRRTDTGNGACELVWVEEVEQLTHESRRLRARLFRLIVPP